MQNTFIVKGPDGTEYEVQAPAGATEADIIARVQEAHAAETAQDPKSRMSPEDETGYIALAKDPEATSADLMAYVGERGFNLSQEDADAFIEAREAAGGQAGDRVDYNRAPEAPEAPEEAPAAPEEPDDTLPAGENTLGEDFKAGMGAYLDGVLPGTAATVRGIRGAALNGFGSLFGDETFDPGAAYTEAAEEQKALQARFAATNPSLSDGLGYGGIVSSLALPGANVVKGGRLTAGMANGAITAAGYGTASGLMNDTGEGRLVNGILGGTFGATLGSTAPVVANRAAGWASNARRNIPGLNEAVTALGNVPNRIRGLPTAPPSASAHAQAERMIAEQMNGRTNIATGMGTGTVPVTPQSVEAEVARRAALGVPAIPADVSEPLRRTTGWALNGSGTATMRARAAIQARQAQQANRVRTHIGAELGPAVDPIQAAEGITRRAKAAAAPAYQQAYAAGSPMQITPELRAIMDTPAFREALPQARRNIMNRQGDPTALGFETLPSGEVTLSPQPSFEAFDQVTRTLNGQLKRNPLTGRPELDNETGAISDVMQTLDGHLREINPDFAAAKSAYADEMAIRSGLAQGGDVAKLSGPEIAAQTRTMPEHAREAWGVGARTALADTATQAGLKPNGNVVQKVRQATGMSGAGMAAAPGDAAKLQAIETMTGQPGSMARLDNRLEAENQAFATFSETARVRGEPRGQSGISAINDVVEPVRNLAQGRVLSALGSVILKGNPAGTLRFRTDVKDRVAQILTADSPQSVSEAVAAVANRVHADDAFRRQVHGYGIAPAKAAALQAAGQDTVAHPTPDPEDEWAPMAPLYYRPAPQEYSRP